MQNLEGSRKRFILLGSVLALIGCIGGGTRTASEDLRKSATPTPPPNVVGAPECETLRFRFVTLADFPDTDSSRRIEVFLENKSFGPENLEVLLDFISRRHADTPSILIEVKTDWSQIEPPSDCPGSGLSGRGDGITNVGHNRALLYRRDGMRYFRYTIDPNSPKLTTVKVAPK